MFVSVLVCMCFAALVHHRLWLCLVSSSPTGALLPGQRVMAYLLLIEAGTGDSDTPIMALNVPGPLDRRWGGRGGWQVLGFVTRKGKHEGFKGLTLKMELVTAQRKAQPVKGFWGL